MLIFSSPRQLRLLHSCNHIISDGTFKEVMLEDNDDEEDAHEAAVQVAELRGLAQEIPEEEAHLNVVFDAE
uniref:Uncharacterized protein n=1 Tax=Ditylenchus dipsaci TaxID=166011 RepID=A0A915EP11_9BILA